MRKIRVKNDMYIQGWGTIKAGTEYKVDRYNTRYVYVMLKEGVTMQFGRKDVEKVY